MDQRLLNPAVEVEKFSKLGTQDLQNNHPERALESFKYAFKRSRELEDDGYTERACAFNLGAVYIALGNGKKGIEILNKALPPDNTREGRSNGDLFFNLGLGYENVGNSEEAVRNFKKALEEYKVERDNVQMEAETLEKLGQLYLKTKNRFAVDTFDQLAQAYDILKNPAKQLWALTEKANQQFANGLEEEAEKSAEECLKLVENCGSSVNIGTILNDLGLIFTQRQKYDRAVSCFESALPMVEGPSGDGKQLAVIFQNLGATFNFLGNYQRAVEYHEKAADMYAKLRNRTSQGQCFANMAFAYSQLGDIHNAGEAFLHAFQAAKDSDDKRTQWQVCEGLGAVWFNQKNIKKAVEYFQKALTLVASSEPSNTVAQNRIVAKITLALQTQVQKESAPVVEKVNRGEAKIIRRTPVKESFIKKEVAVPVQSSPMAAVGSSPKHERFVPVGRKGSSLRYEKVARGLSKDTIITDTFRSSTRSSMIDIESESEEDSEEEADEEEEEEEDSDIDKTIHQTETPKIMRGRDESRASSNSIKNTSRRQSVKAAQVQGLHNVSTESSDSSESEEDTARKEEDEDDQTAVKEAMKKQLHSQGSSDSDSDSTPQTIRSFKKRQDEEESDPDSSEDEAPPLPTQSPPVTTKPLAGTYESPGKVQEKRIHYADVEHSKSPRPGGQGSSEDDDPLYQSIPARTDSARSRESLRSREFEIDTPTFEKGPRFQNYSDLPRGVKDVHQFQEHQRLVRQRKELEEQNAASNDSKTCAIM